MRKGFFASGGAARPKGTAMMTEDVAAPIDRLADFVIDMRKLLDDHGYEDAIIFGHALAGNLHFQMSDNFAEPGSAEKFDRFSKDLSELVSVRYEGSLKAEHGTGRAIAPFVEREWGSAAYRIMQKIKPLFDPEGLLNPGVLITSNQTVHIEHLKVMPLADPVIDLCIECGFCEPACPSHQLTLSPRQRIVTTREMARLRATGEDDARLAAMSDSFDYAGLDTCAAGNVCAGRCPVGIETGTMVIGERARRKTRARRSAAHRVADHTLADRTRAEPRHRRAGAEPHHYRRRRDRRDGRGMRKVAKTPRGQPGVAAGTGRAPASARQTVRANPKTDGVPVPIAAPTNRVVYFPACPTRMFGRRTDATTICCRRRRAMMTLLTARRLRRSGAGGLDGQCCGQPFLQQGLSRGVRAGRRAAATSSRPKARAC